MPVPPREHLLILPILRSICYITEVPLIAQLVELLPLKEKVGGSNPSERIRKSECDGTRRGRDRGQQSESCDRIPLSGYRYPPRGLEYFSRDQRDKTEERQCSQYPLVAQDGKSS
jgi:hypothetical protein